MWLHSVNFKHFFHGKKPFHENLETFESKEHWKVSFDTNFFFTIITLIVCYCIDELGSLLMYVHLSNEKAVDKRMCYGTVLYCWRMAFGCIMTFFCSNLWRSDSDIGVVWKHFNKVERSKMGIEYFQSNRKPFQAPKTEIVQIAKIGSVFN